MRNLSAEALKALFSPEGDSDLFILLTIYAADETTPLLNLSDGYTQRLSETTQDILYGIISNGVEYTFLPMEISLPSEEEGRAPKCSIVIKDVVRYLIPTIRNLSYSPKIKLQLVLSKTPNVVEVTYSGFYITSFSYNAEQVTAELSMIDYEREPFPAHSFSPAYFPGLF
jgi:hypothetical protein